MVTHQNGGIFNGLGNGELPFDEFGSGADGYQHNSDQVFYERSSSPATIRNRHASVDDRAKNIATEYGINVRPPKHRQYALKSVRVSSFRNWPSYVNQQPENLAEAGFFYSGNSDAVFCFYCGQGLQSWQDEDIPWCEHARWSPDCPFLLNIKGREFVRLEQLKNTDPVQYITEKAKQVNVTEEHQSDKGFEEDVWNHPAVESLLQNGYSKESAQKALFLFRQRNGDNTPFSAPDLLAIIFDLEDGVVTCDFVEKEEPEQQENDLAERENEQLRKSVYCRKCRSSLVSVVFLPCGHLCTCTDCGPSVKHCLICDQFIKGTVRTYLV